MSSYPPNTDPASNKQFKVFQSTNLVSGSYDPATSTLQLSFYNGSVYTYSFVPLDVWVKLTASMQPGTFFKRMIEPNFIGKRTQ